MDERSKPIISTKKTSKSISFTFRYLNHSIDCLIPLYLSAEPLYRTNGLDLFKDR